MKTLALHKGMTLIAALAIGIASVASDALARGTGGAAARLSSDAIPPGTWPGMRHSGLPTENGDFNHTKALHNGACRQYGLIAEPLYHRGPISYHSACEESSSRWLPKLIAPRKESGFGAFGL
jgi:hypothetical protein